MPPSKTLLPTTLVGSYAQPDWLINRDKLGKQMPPRVRAADLWRVPLEWLEQAQDDATRLAIRDQERAGLDILTDGEMRRESYSNRFATALDGLDLDNPGKVISRSGHEVLVPRITGKIRRKHAVQVRDIQFLRANTDRTIKITVPGPFTMTQQAVDEFYKDEKAVALDYAAAVNEEIKDLFAAGADVVQIDEPWMQSSPDKARKYGVDAINRALDGVKGTTAVHICFGYAALVAGPARRIFLSRRAGADSRTSRSRSKPRSPSSIVRCSRNFPAKPSFWACWIYRPTISKRLRWSRSASAARCLLSAPTA